MRSRDLVSIIIPAYNSSRNIKCCIDSCLSQTYGDIEIIVVNDGSSDNTGSILNENYKKYSQIKIITTINQGVSAARKTGVEIANGKWIFFLDSDDTIPEYAIENLVKKAEDNKSDLVIGDMTYLNQDLSVLRVSKNHIDTDPVRSALTFQLSCNLCGRLISRDCIKNIQWPSKNIKIGEDVICGMQLLLKCSNVTTLGLSIYNYIQYPGSTINSHDPSKVRSMIFYLRTLDEYFPDGGPYREYADYFITNEYFAYLMYGGDWECYNEYKLKYKRCKLNFPIKIKIAFSHFGRLALKVAQICLIIRK